MINQLSPWSGRGADAPGSKDWGGGIQPGAMSCRQGSLCLGAPRAGCALQAPGNSCQDWSGEESWDCSHAVSPAWGHPAAAWQKG